MMLTPSDKSIDMILRFESDDDSVPPEKGYNPRPEWPEGNSGITIGFGYDLGYYTKSEFLEDWKGLSDSAIAGLYGCLGVKGENAEELLPNVRDIVIPYEFARAEFMARVLPAECVKTLNTFPGCDKLPPDAQGALVSLIYNRGTDLEGDRRFEMRQIADICDPRNFPFPHGYLNAIASCLRAMKRLWPKPKQEGLRRHREAEAVLVERAIFP